MEIQELEQRAHNGDLNAQCTLGYMYELGLDCEANFERAATYWRLAAAQGHAVAKARLAEMMRQGKVPGGATEIRELRYKARKAGVRSSQAAISELVEQVNEATSRLADTPTTRAKILLVDDEEEVRQILRTILVGQQFQVIEAVDGKVAFTEVGNHPDIRLILLDIAMPNVNGLQFLRALRNLRAADGVPVAVITGGRDPKQIAEAKQLGVSAWLLKPIDRAHLLSTVSKLIPDV